MIQIRNSCFETNSSSSHSVCISMDGQESQEIWDLIKDDTLYIYPRDGEFDDLKTNECLSKLQFLVALVCNDVVTTHGNKRIKQFRTRLKKMFGVGNVYMGHVDEYYKALKERNNKPWKDKYEIACFLKDNFKLDGVGILDLDRTLEEEIFETPETLRSFILSPGSWLYSTETAIGTPGYYKFRSEMYCVPESDLYDSIATVCYGPDLKVDIKVNIFGCSFNYYDRINNLMNKVITEAGDIIVDSNSGKLVKSSVWDKRVALVGDKYSLIQLEPREPFLSEDELNCIDADTFVRFKENKIRKFDGKVPDYAKSCEVWPIIIQSKEFLGNLNL